MSKTKNAPDNDVINIQPEAVKEMAEIAKTSAAPEPAPKPRRRASLNLQIAAKIDLLLQEAAKGFGDIAILEFLCKDRGYELVESDSVRLVATGEVFDRR